MKPAQTTSPAKRPFRFRLAAIGWLIALASAVTWNLESIRSRWQTEAALRAEGEQ